MEEEKSVSIWKIVLKLLFHITITVAVIAIGIWGIFYFIPFVIAWTIALIASPLVRWLEKRLKIVRKIGSAMIIILVIGLIVLLGYFLVVALIDLIESIAREFPTYSKAINEEIILVIDRLEDIFNLETGTIQEAWVSWSSHLGETLSELLPVIGEPTVSMAGNIAGGIPSFLISTIVMIVATYFFIADREGVILWAKKVTPRPIQRRMEIITYNFKYAVGGYFKAQFKIMLVVIAIVAVALIILGVDYGIFFAILIGFLDFLPFFGTAIVLVPWAIFRFLSGDYTMAIVLLITYVTTQGVRQLIQPKLVADSVGIKPLLALVLLYVGYQVDGVLGMIIAIPLGLIAINLHKAGAFDYILDDVKLLAIRLSGKPFNENE